jgi:DNA gyrase subunit A
MLFPMNAKCFVSASLLTVTEGGMGKRTPFSDFREMKHRGGRGGVCHKISEKTGKLSAIITVSEDDDIMLITDEGTIIRTSVSSINLYSRGASGVIIMRIGEGAKLSNIARLEKAEEIEAAAEVDNQNITEASEGEAAPEEN